jgi:hypothetical protein
LFASPVPDSTAPAQVKRSRALECRRKQIEDLGEIVAVDSDVAGKLRANVNVRTEFTSNAELTGITTATTSSFFR